MARRFYIPRKEQRNPDSSVESVGSLDKSLPKIQFRKPRVQDLERIHGTIEIPQSPSLYFSMVKPPSTPRMKGTFSPLSRQPVSDWMNNPMRLRKDRNLQCLFDRHQTTLNAPFVSDEHNTPVNDSVGRIGYFMQYTEQLLFKHLYELAPSKLMQQQPKGLPNASSQHFIGIGLHRQLINKQSMPAGNVYDPSRIGWKSYCYDLREWPAVKKSQYIESKRIYETYCQELEWDKDELIPMTKEQLRRILTLVHITDVEQGKRLIAEVRAQYKQAMKVVLLNYVLLSKKQRERLGITYIPKAHPTSYARIHSVGGYDRRIHHQWYLSVLQIKHQCEASLPSIYTPIQRYPNVINIRAILDWSDQLKNFSPFELKNLVFMAQLGLSFSIVEFHQVQTVYLKLSTAWLYNVWYRGCISIIKGQKYLHREDTSLRELWFKTVKRRHLTSRFQNQFDAWLYILQKRLNLNSESFSNSMQLMPINSKASWKELPKQQREDILKNIRTLLQIILHQNFSATLNSLFEFFKQYSTDEHPKVRYLRSVEMQQQQDAINEAMASPGLMSRNQSPTKSTKSWVFSRGTLVQSVLDIDSMKKIQIPGVGVTFDFPDDDCFPIFELQLIVKDGLLLFDIQDEEIVDLVTLTINQATISYDKIPDPRFVRLSKSSECQTSRISMQSFIGESIKQQVSVLKRFKNPNFQVIEQTFAEIYTGYCNSIEIAVKQPNHYKLQKKRPTKDLSSILAEWENQKLIQVTPQKTNVKFISKLILRHYKEAGLVFTLFHDLRCVISGEAQMQIDELLQRQPIPNEVIGYHMKVLSDLEKINQAIPDSISLPMFRIRLTPSKLLIQGSINAMQRQICSFYESFLQTTGTVLLERYNEIYVFMRKQSHTVEDAVAMDKFLHEVFYEIIQLQQSNVIHFQNLLFYIDLDQISNQQIINQTRDIFKWPTIISKDLPIQEDKRLQERNFIQNSLQSKRAALQVRIQNLASQTDKYQNFTEYTKHQRYVGQIDEYIKLLLQAERESQELRTFEMSLNGKSVRDDSISDLIREMMPYNDMWKSISQFSEMKKQVMSEPITRLDPLQLESMLKQHQKTSLSLWNQFKPDTFAFRVANEFKEDLQLVTKILPLVEMLTKQGMGQRHWESIEKLLNVSFEPQQISVRELLRFNVEQFVEIIEEISDTAQKEHTLESAITKMEKEWEKIEFVLGYWKNRDIKMFQGGNLEDIQLLLDDHTIKAQMIRGNPSVKFMEEKAHQWEKTMLYIQEVLEVWIKVQGMYVYLEPIFKFEDINKSLQSESQKFQTVNRIWLQSMAVIEADPHVLNIYNTPTLLADLKLSLEIMEQIQKALEHHLELKRIEFPRFFFLSNDELISTLAEARDPVHVQHHLKKCFEGVDTLIFGAKDTDIIGVRSKDKEEIRFIDKINIKDFRSSIEKWLQRVDDNSKKALARFFDICLTDLNTIQRRTISRKDWVFKHPGQAVICIGSVHWTMSVESLLRNNVGDLPQYFKRITEQLEEIVMLVRGYLSELQRTILSSQIVMEVHQKDIIDELLRNNITNHLDFGWQSHMRYYYSPETRQVNVRMIQSRLDYGFEYLGTISRLVITPLTDRCFRTMMQAVAMNLGGAPEGPAGTGKTESIKDLSKALAIQCIVFNCSEGLNVVAMSNFFKGLSAGGAWSCFDEFNRIDVEVLSVIASQILTIQQAKELRKNQFFFDGTLLNFNQNCNIFITMNPGYSGRSELPDNLQALFRPCAMMIPDFAMIAEISLFSFGFLEARYLSKKIVTTYELCQQQLSQQGHYDYGMRAIKAALIAAQNIKRKYPQWVEELIVLRAMCDINIPKFIEEDQALFAGIVKDLFPNTKLTNEVDPKVHKILEQLTQQLGLQMVDQQMRKLHFLWEMLGSRHGIMLVGDTMSGKTTTTQLMLQCMNKLTAIRPNQKKQPEHQLHVINPKAMTLHQLFGRLDIVTKEWTEGIIGEVFRRCSQLAYASPSERQFILLDGPVDSFWIENLNTVLDDNKKLCLINGDVIDMPSAMCMLFEVPDLYSASQATISRCGMIYFPDTTIGWESLFKSFIQQLEGSLEESLSERLLELFHYFVHPVFSFVNDCCVQYQKVPDLAKMQFLMRMLKTNFTDHGLLHSTRVTEPQVLINKFDSLFIFALYQTAGCCIEQNYRKDLEMYIRKLFKETLPAKAVFKMDKICWPQDGAGQTLQDLYFYFLDGTWRSWKDQQDPGEVKPNGTMVIETSDVLRLRTFIQQTVHQHQPVLLIGPTGTGKTFFLDRFLAGLPPDRQLIIKVMFSSQTQPSHVQELVELKIERKRKGVFGPPKIGQKCQIFIDDLSMPIKDRFGDQAPIELLRQLVDYHGWYAKDRKFIEIIDTNLIAAMSPPGGGKNSISIRLLRHFNIYSIREPDSKNFYMIYSSMMSAYTNMHYDKIEVNSELKSAFNLTVDATYDLYTNIVAHLKPTPAKCHYLFNMRNVSRIYEGMQMAPPELLAQNYRVIFKLWVHEVCRVFLDRLYGSDDDQHWFVNTLSMIIKSKLRDDLKDLIYLGRSAKSSYPLEALRDNMFMDIFSSNPNEDSSFYMEQNDFKVILIQAERALEDFNSNSKKPMELILFDYAIDHLLHIMRILKMVQGHGLLAGLGGSGRQSLSRLAADIRGYQLQQIELSKQYDYSNWKEDLQKLIITAGVERKKVVFLLSDFQIKHDYVLENINSLLNNGEVPGLFTNEDMIPIVDQIRLNAKKENKLNITEQTPSMELYNYMIQTSIHYLHIILALSPVGDQFRNRIRAYPNIVNCTTIDWFKQWPEEALMTVASKFIGQLYIDKSISVVQVSAFCIYMHQSSIALSQRYLQAEGRYNYVTASSYLELMKLFKMYLHSTQSKLQEQRQVYQTGVSKLYSTQTQVKQMGEELVEKKEKLIILNRETQKIADVIHQQAMAMEPKKKKIEVEEQLVNQRVKEAEIMSIECERDLSIAKPKLKQAQEALNTLDSNDINNIRVMLKPPETVQLVMEAVCIICQVPPIMLTMGKNVKIPSYWEASKKFISEKDFLKQLINFDKDNIPDNVINKVRQGYISNTAVFNAKRVEKASSAAKGLCEWILALDEYDKVLKIIRPKQQKFNEAKIEVAELQASLKKTRDELAILNQEIMVLEQNYQQTKEKQQELEDEINDCEQKVIRASSLISQLGGEQTRWDMTVQKLHQKLNFIVGDTLMSSGIISYLGPFSVAYRSRQILQWIDNVRKQGSGSLMISDHYSLESTLGDPIMIRKWTANGLPLDSFSKENAIITYYSQRWPLLIDPQGQANKWIRQNEMENKVISIRQSESDFVKHLENAITFGYALIIENVEQDVDPSLDPLLLKQTFRQQGSVAIKLGENIISYSKFFKMFLTSKMGNPHFPPEVSTKVTLVNFTITSDSLEAQLLELCVKKERPELEETRQKLILRKFENERQLESIEQQILQILNQVDNILNDEKAIETLKRSKKVAFDIEEENKTSLITQRKIDEARIVYKSIATHSSILFFCAISMSTQAPIYQFSLSWFINLYDDSFDKAEANKHLQTRIDNIIEVLTRSIYNNVCRALFEKHKLLFSLLMTIKIMETKKNFNQIQLTYLINQTHIQKDEEAQLIDSQESKPAMLTYSQWLKLLHLGTISKRFQTIPQSINAHPEQWSTLLHNQISLKSHFPDALHDLTSLQKLCVIKAIKPESLLKAIVEFIGVEMGEEFTRPPPFSLQSSFLDSHAKTPMVFVLPGNDPLITLQTFSDAKHVELKVLSLGQGQGKKAEKLIEDAYGNGQWVLLQNCHLFPSWMSSLERVCEELEQHKIPEQLNPQFRLWLTTYPSQSFPLSILQKAIKMTNEPPKGLKANLHMSYSGEKISDPNFFELQPKPKEFKTLLFGLCLFHAVLQERKTYGFLGFNSVYNFTQSDLRISIQQLEGFLKLQNEIPYKTLQYLVAECNYGGRVTDEKDRRVINAVIQDYFSEVLFEDNYMFGGAGGFAVPENGPHTYYLRFINSLDKNISSSSELIGFHQNADIAKDIKDIEELFQSILVVSSSEKAGTSQTQDNDASKPKNQEQLVRQQIQELISRMPKPFDFKALIKKYPYDYYLTMNTVLIQEIEHYNKLITVIVSSLKEVELVLRGLSAFSEQSENVFRSLQYHMLPDYWKKFSYPTLKPLGSYIFDLQKRLTYFSLWCDNGEPTSHWISAYFQAQGFLTAVMQNTSRKLNLSLDQLTWKFEFWSEQKVREKWNKEFNQNGQTQGTLIYGLFFEGVKWDYDEHCLEEQDKQQLLVPAPYILLIPSETSDVGQTYQCPVFKTLERRGTQATTSHQKYIFDIHVPTKKPVQHWVKRGTALICQLND